MAEDTVTTGVDDLIELLRGKQKISLAEASKQLSLPEHTLQSWVDFLVEEEIIGVEYKFTKPYIYLIEEEETEEEVEKKESKNQRGIEEYRKEFFEKAKKKEIPEEKIPEFWQKHLIQEVNSLKKDFIKRAEKKGMRQPEQLWREYVDSLKKRAVDT